MLKELLRPFIKIIVGCRVASRQCEIYSTWIYVKKTFLTYACFVYMYAYLKACMRIRMYAYACLGFPCTFSLPNHPSSQSFTRLDPKSNLVLRVTLSLENGGSGRKRYKMKYLQQLWPKSYSSNLNISEFPFLAKSQNPLKKLFFC